MDFASGMPNSNSEPEKHFTSLTGYSVTWLPMTMSVTETTANYGTF